ncbi:MAG: gamma-glutamyl-gamma-aminobutyrate hydrolase family protein [Lentisphaeria bacterium]|nr:gamma-glutamyl-gamma-aminobutyrate hydrolase family protein [Lentisphaeria bacterium]
MKNSRPTIAISGQYNTEKELITMRPSYIAALENAGAIPVIIPITENRTTLDFYLENCDALLLSGGQDIQPHLYGEETLPHCGEQVPVRDRIETYLFERAMALDKVIFGICRGFQMVNVAAGGTLYQDLRVDFGTSFNHRMEEPFNRESHNVTAVPGTPLAELFGEAPFAVNSVHHQGAKDLGKGLKPMAISEDGIVEAVYMPDRRFVWAVQWHPEWFFEENANSAALIKTFVDAAKE